MARVPRVHDAGQRLQSLSLGADGRYPTGAHLVPRWLTPPAVLSSPHARRSPFRPRRLHVSAAAHRMPSRDARFAPSSRLHQGRFHARTIRSGRSMRYWTLRPLSARVPLWSWPLQASRVDAAVLVHASVSLGLCPVVGVRIRCAWNDPSGDRRAGQSASGNMASGLNSSSRRPSLARRRRGALHHSFWRLRSCASSCARLGHLLGRRLAPSRRSQHGRPGHTVRYSCRRALGRAKTCTLPGQDAAAVSTRGLSASPMARLDWHNLPGGIHGAISPIAPSSSPRFRPLRSPASKWAAFVRRETHKGRKRHVSFARSLSLNFSLILLSTLMDMLRN